LLADPLAPVLQIENNHLASQGFFCFFRLPFESKLSTVGSQIKNPLNGGDCFLLDRGGKRTIIEPPGRGYAEAYHL